ncbi:MAG TPA: YceI family protein [Steroidobacteraceae bacterium]|nr:YceI family protein [Steroidobacteraceae bacterium]
MIRGIAFAFALLVASVPLSAATYTLEPDYTQGVFRWNHLGFSFPSAQFAQGQGTLEFDQAYPARASVTVTIPLSSLYTGVPALDEHMRSADFFDVAQYPTVTFKSRQVEKAMGHNQLRVMGDLTVHGVTKPVTLDVTLIKVGTNPRTHLPTVGFSGNATVSRSQFGLGKFVPQVADEIYIQIGAQAVESQAYSKYLKEKEAADAAEKVAEQNK